MDDNLEKNIKQFADLLSKEGVIDSLKGILGDMSSDDNSQKKDKEFGEQSSDRVTSKSAQEDMRFVQNIAKAMSELRNIDDPSANLLEAIRPLLNEKRQKICKDCIKIIRMAKVVELIQKHDQDFNL